MKKYDDELVSSIRHWIGILHSSSEVVSCIHALLDLAENEEDIANLIVECGAVPELIRHLQDPHEEFIFNSSIKYQLEMAIVQLLPFLATNSEHQQLIVDAGALPCLVKLLKLPTDCGDSMISAEVVVYMAAGVITKLADKNSSIKASVRIEGGIPPLVELLEFKNSLVQISAAVALRTLAVDDDANKTQIVECNALPVLIQMLRFQHLADEAIRVIGTLVYKSPSIMNDVLLAGALQPIIDMLSSRCIQSQLEAAFLVGQFADSDTDCKVHIVQRGAVGPLIQMLQSPYHRSAMSAFALARLAQDTHNQVGIAHCGGISPLLEALVYSGNEVVQNHAAVALYRLAENEDNVVDFIREDGVLKLLSCDFVAQSIQDCVALTLKRLEEKIHGRVLSHLLYLMRIAEINVRIPVALALAHLCSPDDQKTIFVDNDGLGILLKLLEADDSFQKRNSCIALYKLAEKARSHSTVDTRPPSLISQVYLGEQYVNNPTLSDATFLIEGKRFYAHRVCLLAASDAFRAMFDGGYKEKDAQEILISNIRLDVFELMMRYIYTGSVDVNLEIAQDLLVAADQYLLQGLKRLCEHAIAEDIQVDNVSLMYDLSEAFDAVSLRDACILFVLENFDELFLDTWYMYLLKRILPEIRNCFVRLFARPMEADMRQ